MTMAHEFCSVFIQNTVKQGRSLTHLVSPDEIQHMSVQRVRCLPSDCWRETFLANDYGFCRCFKTWQDGPCVCAARC